MATANMRHFNSPEELAKRESTPAAATRSQGFRHFNSPEEIAKRTGKPVAAPAVASPARRVIDVKPEPAPPVAPSSVPLTGLALREQTRPIAGPGEQLTETERLALLERFVFALLDSPAEAREWRLQLHNISATVEAHGLLVAKVNALGAEVDQLISAANVDGSATARLRSLEAAVERLEASLLPPPAAAAQAPAVAPEASATPDLTSPNP